MSATSPGDLVGSLLTSCHAQFTRCRHVLLSDFAAFDTLEVIKYGLVPNVGSQRLIELAQGEKRKDHRKDACQSSLDATREDVQEVSACEDRDNGEEGRRLPPLKACKLLEEEPRQCHKDPTRCKEKLGVLERRQHQRVLR